MTRPLRALFLDHTAQLGGGEIALVNLLAELRRRHGHAIEPAVLLFEDGPLLGRLRDVGIDAAVLPLDASVNAARKDSLGGASALRAGAALRAGRFVRRLAGEVESRRVDVVYCNSLKSDLLGGLAARLAGVPCVWHVRDRIADDYLPRRVAALFRLAARAIPAAVVANSRHTLETLGLPYAKRTAVAYSGVVRPADAPPVPGGPPVIALVGRLAPWKGQHVLIDAAAIVAREVPGLRVRLIGAALFGEDSYERSLREQVERLGLGEVVEFRGFRDDVAAELAASTLVVHASITPEPFGQVVVEAMAAGRAVVATDGGGVRETVVDGETGLLVPPNDAPSMAAAVVRLLRDAPLRRSMANAGRARVAAHFTADRTAATVARFLQSVARRR